MVSSTVLANITWIDARSKCGRDGGHLVSDIINVSCNAFNQPNDKKVWIQEHKTASWILSKGKKNFKYKHTLK